MPYVKKTTRANVAPNHEDLVEAIKNEFSPKTLAQEAFEMSLPRYETPCIIEGTLRHSDKLEVYVVWDGWKDIREDHRTTAILDAYEREFPEKRVVIALGVTPEEGKELGVIE